MSNLFFYYPTTNGAPSNVSRKIFSALVSIKTNFKVYMLLQCNSKHSEIQKQYISYKILNIKSLLEMLNEKSIVHLTTSPLIFPNLKFLYYVCSIIKKSKLIINFHGNPDFELGINLKSFNYRYLTYLPTYFFLSYILKSANCVVVNSFSMKKAFSNKYGTKNIVVIPNGLDSTWFEDNDTTVESNNSKNITIFYHGRLSAEKGVDILIRAFSIVISRNKKNMILYIAGDGPQKKYLLNLCNELNLHDKVFFLGTISQMEIRKYLKMVDAAIYPSKYDAFSLAVLEAFSVAKGPVFYSKNAGIHDFVVRDKFNLNSFNPTIDSLVGIMNFICLEKYDKSISIKQKEFAYNYRWESIIKEYNDLYNELFNAT